MRQIVFGLSALVFCAGSAFAVPVMHVHDSSGNLATVDVQTGTVSVIGNMGAVFTDIAFDTSGDLYGITFTGLYSINPTTAVATFIGPTGLSGGNALVFDSNDTLYAASNNTLGIYTLNTGTGASTLLGNTGFASGGDLAIHSGKLFLASSTNQLVELNLADLPESQSVGPFGVGNVFGLATGDDGFLYGVAGTNIYTVNPLTGAATLAINYGGQGLGQAFGQSFTTEAVQGEIPPIPEPSTYVMMGLGLLGFGLMIRRRRG